MKIVHAAIHCTICHMVAIKRWDSSGWHFGPHGVEVFMEVMDPRPRCRTARILGAGNEENSLFGIARILGRPLLEQECDENMEGALLAIIRTMEEQA